MLMKVKLPNGKEEDNVGNKRAQDKFVPEQIQGDFVQMKIRPTRNTATKGDHEILKKTFDLIFLTVHFECTKVSSRSIQQDMENTCKKIVMRRGTADRLYGESNLDL